LVPFTLRPGADEVSEHAVEVEEVLLEGRGMDNDVVDVGDGAGSELVLQHFVDESLEGGRAVGESEGEDGPFPEPGGRNAGGLVDVLGVHAHLPVAGGEVHSGDPLGRLQALQAVLDAWKGEGVLDGDGIEAPVVDTQPPLAVLLLGQHEGRGPRRCRRAQQTGFDEGLHLPVDVTEDVRALAVVVLLDRTGDAGVDAVVDVEGRRRSEGVLREHAHVALEQSVHLLALGRCERGLQGAVVRRLWRRLRDRQLLRHEGHLNQLVVEGGRTRGEICKRRLELRDCRLVVAVLHRPCALLCVFHRPDLGP
jgi:hypothetical protein